MVELMSHESTYTVKFDMCRYGMHAGGVPVRKPTAIVRNSFEVARRLQRRCKGKLLGEDEHHEHFDMQRQNAKIFQVHPRQLCHTICEGIAAPKKHDTAKLQWNEMMSLDELNSLSEIANIDLSSFEDEAEELLHEVDDSCMVAFDDVSGETLCPAMVRKARAEELGYFKEMGVYNYVKVTECLRKTNRTPITTR